MTVVVAFVLSLMATGLKPIHDRNEAIFNKKAVLAAIETRLGDDVKAKEIPDEEVLVIFDEQIEQLVVDISGNPVSSDIVEGRGYKGGMAEHIDMKKEKKRDVEDRIFPVYIYNDDSGQKTYIVTVRGNGLWDEIWGNIALEADLSTIAGASFDHKGETPGLGAEIKDNPAFPAQFKGKKIYNTDGQFLSVDVVKGGAEKGDVHAVDGISGATVTADGVDEMLERGLKYYEPFINQMKSGGGNVKD